MVGQATTWSARVASSGVTAAQSDSDWLGPERVVEIQRSRILTAMVDMCAEFGSANVAVASVVARAGVSRRTFYEIFEDYEDCFLAAFDEGIVHVSRWMSESYDPAAPWPARVRSATISILQFLDAEPSIGRLLVVDSLGMGAAALERRQRVLSCMTSVVDEGHKRGKRGEQYHDLTAEGVVGGAISVVHARMLGPRPARLAGLAGSLVSMIVLPYLGPAVAHRELKLSVPESCARPTASPRDPLRGLEMRLTYRTVRALLAIAERPGASNTQIAGAADIADQGQISKLLSRLQRLGLAENTGLALGKGAPNSWVLTDRGRQVAHGMTAETTSRESW